MDEAIPNQQMQKQPFSIEALSYCYSAVVSQISCGVLQAKENEILRVLAVLLGSQSLLAGAMTEDRMPGSTSTAQKYAVICL